MLPILPLSAQATLVDDGTSCPNDPGGWHEWVWVSTDDANCQHGIIERYRCANCGKTTSEEYGELGDHAYGCYQTINPTCTEYGGYRRVCSVCGDVEELLEVEPLGHDMQETGKNPTCTEGGYACLQCTRCGIGSVTSNIRPWATITS